ncbi:MULTISPECIES: hypothetical protein [unclassified Nitrospina]|uniref:hypothetical protein n=1 Tax=unclassified Nitrospina TaxID=2638683 RepID=UPI003F966478
MKRFLIVGSIAMVLAWAGLAAAITYKGDLEADESVMFSEQATPPSNPPSGKRKLYFQTDGNLMALDSFGIQNPVISGEWKNVVINGDFRLWQRGTSFANPNGGYGPDRWKLFGGVGNTTVYSRQIFTLGQTDVPGEPQYFLSMEKAGGNGAPPELRHLIESVRTFAGQTVTLTYYAKADSARGFNARLDQIFGNGGTPSGPRFGATLTCNLTTAWQKCTATWTLGGLSGKTLGTNGDDHLQIAFGWPSNADGVIDIARVQLEAGSIGTAFEKRAPDVERQLAERYYRLFGFGMTGGWHGAGEVTLGLKLVPPMRAACTLALNDTTPVVNEVSVGDKTGSGSAIAASSISSKGVWVKLNGFSGATAGNPAVAKEDGLFTCDAEL